MNRRLGLFLILLGFLAWAVPGALAQEVHGKRVVHASLLADTSAIVPGKPFMAGLLLKMEPGWHTYYKDPGDSGLAPTIDWNLPPGFSAGEIRWPPPTPHVEPGDLKVNIYENEVLLRVPITVPPKVTGESVRLSAVAKWLVCSEMCVPGQADLSLDLPVSETAAPANTELFQKYASTSIGKPDSSAVDLPTGGPGAGGFWTNLVFGFIGGLLLNVMPCVLPVIALKIMGFVQQAGASPARTLRLGLAFVAGIFVWFLGLAALLVGFKLLGRDINWAFQFQNPWFVGIAFVLVLVFALNLLGLFEVVLPQSANERLVQWVAHEGYGGAFLHGVFATLLATPCTAPFLGPALGYAIGRQPSTIFAIFTAIAAGMSFPYLLLTARPGWLRFMPKPGMWMVRVKQFMGLLLLGTAVWLGWIVWQQQTKPRPAETFAVRLEHALATGRPVFVDFTADWCVNCKVNEKFVLKTGAVQDALKKKNVEFLVADWTRGDADVTEMLRKFGRAGVPLYVYYPNDGRGPVVLPEVVTVPMVVQTIKNGTR